MFHNPMGIHGLFQGQLYPFLWSGIGHHIFGRYVPMFRYNPLFSFYQRGENDYRLPKIEAEDASETFVPLPNCTVSSQKTVMMRTSYRSKQYFQELWLTEYFRKLTLFMWSYTCNILIFTSILVSRNPRPLKTWGIKSSLFHTTCSELPLNCCYKINSDKQRHKPSAHLKKFASWPKKVLNNKRSPDFDVFGLPALRP